MSLFPAYNLDGTENSKENNDWQEIGSFPAELIKQTPEEVSFFTTSIGTLFVTIIVENKSALSCF